jgi:hypothetical protein
MATPQTWRATAMRWFGKKRSASLMPPLPGAARMPCGIGPVLAPGDFDLPDQVDWLHRPQPWRAPLDPPRIEALPGRAPLSGGLCVFHDGDPSAVRLSQAPSEAGSEAEYALDLDIGAFGGTFVSLVQDLPEDGLRGLGLDHVLSVHLRLSDTAPPGLYARLNVRHGPNLEQMLRHVAQRDGIGVAEFDLAYSRINPRRLEKAWIDLIAEKPDHTSWRIGDALILRAPRADI